jgi:outer membrane protein TolC
VAQTSNLKELIFKISIAIGLATMPMVLNGQEILTLEEAVAIALANNYDIRLAKNDSAVAALDYAYKDAVFYPRINATAGTNWVRNNQKQEFASGPDRSGNVVTNNLSAALALNWTLFDGLKMFATRQKAEEYIRLGELSIKQQVINTIAEVVGTYYSIVREKQQLSAIEEQMEVSQISVDLSQRKLEIGVGAKPEVLQTRVDLNAQRAAQLRQQTVIVQLKETLNQLMAPSPEGTGSSMTRDYEVSDSIPINTLLGIEDITNRLDQDNPTLQIARKNIDIAHITLKEIKATRFPTLDFNATYNFSRSNNDIALNPVLPITSQNRGLNYGLTVSVPILNYRNTHRLIRQAELNIGYQQLLLDNQRSLLRLDVRRAFEDFELQKEALALEEENILLARENVEIILETYRLGQTTYLQLREAQRSLEDAYNRLIAARYLTKLAETELLRLRGGLVR